MIVGGYELHLYCRNGKGCKFISKGYEDFLGGNKFTSYESASSFIGGESKAACMKIAKSRGWKFKADDVICKWCAE